MNALKIFLPLAGCAMLIASSCKKDKAEEYYYGKWSVRETVYTSPDTTYTDEINANINTYNFKADHSVEVVSLGSNIVLDSWELRGNHDSILFGNQADWKILEKNANSFKAKFYMNSNTHMTILLEK